MQDCAIFELHERSLQPLLDPTRRERNYRKAMSSSVPNASDLLLLAANRCWILILTKYLIVVFHPKCVSEVEQFPQPCCITKE